MTIPQDPAHSSLVKYAKRDAERRGLRGDAAERFVNAWVDDVTYQRYVIREKKAGREPSMQRANIEGWLVAKAPSAPPLDIARSGKWLGYYTPPYHDQVWSAIAEATELGELGPESKVRDPAGALFNAERLLPVVVWTTDYEDLDDVRRVLVTMRRLAFPRANLTYKRDIETFLVVYGEGSAIYVSLRGADDFEDRRSSPPDD